MCFLVDAEENSNIQSKNFNIFGKFSHQIEISQLLILITLYLKFPSLKLSQMQIKSINIPSRFEHLQICTPQLSRLNINALSFLDL